MVVFILGYVTKVLVLVRVFCFLDFCFAPVFPGALPVIPSVVSLGQRSVVGWWLVQTELLVGIPWAAQFRCVGVFPPGKVHVCP